MEIRELNNFPHKYNLCTGEKSKDRSVTAFLIYWQSFGPQSFANFRIITEALGT